MLKRILVIFFAVLIVLAVIGMLLPRNIRVERSVTIARPASLIYATVNAVVAGAGAGALRRVCQ